MTRMLSLSFFSLSFLLFLLLSACSGPRSGGQTGSELMCTNDSDCASLGADFRCGPTMICVRRSPTDGGGDARVASEGGTRDGGSDAVVDAVIECRESSVCPMPGPGGELMRCGGPNDFRGCGIPPREECQTDADCGRGTRCHAVEDPCSRDGVGSVCRPPCTGAAGECGPGFECSAGACIATPCPTFGCAAHQQCDPSSVAGAVRVMDQHHGCVDQNCTTDAECGRLFCVNRICQTAVGVCILDRPVP
ncbi:MAG: hypothetical protein AAGF12_03505 [Myxococcota bacterium]